MTFTFTLYVDSVKVNQRANYLCKDHLAQTLLSTHTHTRPTDDTKLVGDKLQLSLMFKGFLGEELAVTHAYYFTTQKVVINEVDFLCALKGKKD